LCCLVSGPTSTGICNWVLKLINTFFLCLLKDNLWLRPPPPTPWTTSWSTLVHCPLFTALANRTITILLPLLPCPPLPPSSSPSVAAPLQPTFPQQAHHRVNQFQAYPNLPHPTIQMSSHLNISSKNFRIPQDTGLAPVAANPITVGPPSLQILLR
jgi:hypothetical protein